MRKEGYWRQTESGATEPVIAGETLGLPWPQALPEPWIGQDTFLIALEVVEGRASKDSFRGWSSCRLCGKPNGSQEFSVGEWVWPSGLRHYIRDHNVRPSDDFIEFILKAAGSS